MMLAKTGNPGRHSFADRADDLYETPACAVQALLEVESLPYVIWEPACGRGAIARVLEAAGHKVHASDLRDYGYGIPGVNFLTTRVVPLDAECILTNPPYKHAEAFVARALRSSPKVVMFLRLAFLESERKAMPERFFLMEYHCEFGSAEDAAFRLEDIEAALSHEVKPLFARA